MTILILVGGAKSALARGSIETHEFGTLGDLDNDRLFSLSKAGHPYFVIGLHSNASRLARSFSHPALVFNSHRQFEKLREDGRYKKMQAATRARHIQLQGSVNSNLSDIGDASESRQYSGRKVDADWKCPFDFTAQP